MNLSLVQGDITLQAVDAIVNAANSSLLGGGGVDGAIHRRGGPTILAACRELRATRYPDGLPTGQAVATTAGALSARAVIHTVGPVHAEHSDALLRETETQDLPRLLASCYRQSLRVADAIGARSIAFPAVSTGAYGWPIDSAANIAVTAVVSSETRVEDVRFVLFSRGVFQSFERAVASAGPSNAQLMASLGRRPPASWEALFAALDALTSADLETRWGGGERAPDGSRAFPHADYSPNVHTLCRRLSELGVVFPFDWPTWLRITETDPHDPVAPVADAARRLTCILRGERFADGTIGQALSDGTLQALVARLRRWYESGEGTGGGGKGGRSRT